MKTVYVIIVNWNGWRDTVECLESVFRLRFDNYRVIVCDNGSTDGSLSRIKKWASGEIEVCIPEANPLRRLSNPPVPKPVRFREYDRVAAETGGIPDDAGSRLILIDTGSNLGFAGGTNVGLRYSMARSDFDYAWILNNDTVVEPDALSHLLDRMEKDSGIGMCGSTIPFYSNPSIIWSRGGVSYNKWVPYFSRSIDIGRPFDDPFVPGDVERRLDLVTAASMLVSCSFLKDIGLMCEDYFLYYEELDWAVRARGRYKLGYAPGSIVYHKVGASTARFGDEKKRMHAARDLNLGNLLRFTRKFYPLAVPTVWLTVLAARAMFAIRKLMSGP